MFAVFLMNKSIETVRTTQSHGSGQAAFFRGEHCGIDFAQDLSFGTIIFVKIWFWSITTGTIAVITDITFGTTLNRLYDFTIPPFNVFDIVRIIPDFVTEYLWKFINLEFLIFRRMGIIKSSLFERDISANKI